MHPLIHLSCILCLTMAVPAAAAERTDAVVLGAHPVMAPAQADAAPNDQASAHGLDAAWERLPRPLRITLEVDGQPPREAFAQLGQQAGVEFRPLPPALLDEVTDQISLQMRDVSFWDALEAIREQSGLFMQLASGRRDLSVSRSDRAWGSRPTSQAGPFLTSAATLQRHGTASLTSGAISRRVGLTLNVYHEPTIRVLRYGAPRLEVAIDDRGRDLVGRAGATNHAPDTMAGIWPITPALGLHLPDDPPSTIALLRGRVPVQVLLRSEQVRFDNILNADAAEGAAETAGGMRLRINNVRRTGTATHISVTVQRQDLPAEEWTRALHATTFELLGSEGGVHLTRTPLYRVAPNQPAVAPDEHETTLLFSPADPRGRDQADEPAVLVWDVPREIIEVEVPFEFRDLPIP